VVVTAGHSIDIDRTKQQENTWLDKTNN